MATSADLRNRVRLELADQPTPFQTSASTDGSIQIFDLPNSPLSAGVKAIGVSASGSTVYVESTDFTVDYGNGVVTFSVAPDPGQIIFSGSSYRYFQDAEIDEFVSTAITQHAYNRTDSNGYLITIANLPTVEEYPVVLLACIQALYALMNDAAYDIDIYAPDGVNIPRHQRYEQLSQMLMQRKAQYDELCEQLNIGLGRVEIFKLRRVAKLTGRYVPVYEEREFEDNRPARRVFLPVNTYGGGAEQSSALQHLDLVAVAQNTYSQQVTGLGNLTGLIVHAHVRPYKESISSIAQFQVTVTDVINGVATLSLTGQQTYYTPRNCFWDLQTEDSTGNIMTLVAGTFTTERQGGF